MCNIVRCVYIANCSGKTPHILNVALYSFLGMFKVQITLRSTAKDTLYSHIVVPSYRITGLQCPP